jgi:succinyl-CoA synthetase beta subunit
VKKAFELLLSSPNVKSIFVNICELSISCPSFLRRGAAGVARGMNPS